MEAELQEHVAFHLTGRRTAGGLAGIDGQSLRPAAFARYRDLSSLRHDFPVVLAAAGETPLVALSALFDLLAAQVAQGADADRIRHHALRLEREIRRAADVSPARTLSSLWEQAEKALCEASGDALLVDSLSKLRAACKQDGEVAACDRQFPSRIVTHAWRSVQSAKSRRMRAAIDRLALKIADILRADDANSADGLSANRLKASVGASFAGDIDFGAMSKLLTTSRPSARLPEARRGRLTRLLTTLQSQAFFPAVTRSKASVHGAPAYDFVFHRTSDALEAYRARMPRMVELAKAMAVASLEIEGRYREVPHDAMFEAIGADEMGASELAQFPDYLVCVSADALDAAAGANLMEALSAGLPIKILLVTDDLVAPSQAADGHASTGVRVRRLASAAISLGGVFVMQAPSSHLVRLRERLLRGLSFPGPALLSVYSGAGGAMGDLHPYLAAAAAAEARAFPAFTYDPSAGDDWASRFTLDHNAQADRPWPVHRLEWEDATLQRASAETNFTLVDFLACDARYARHFASVPKDKWNGRMVPVADFVASEPQGLPDRVPYTMLTDGANRLHRVLVDAKLIREARHCIEQWRSLQELGGIRNSHAERLLAKERKAWEERAAAEAAARAAEAPAAAAPAAQTATTAAAPVAAAAAPAAAKRDPDEPYIETPRCSTCNECTRINDRMFKYDQNKQAYIADTSAGTFAQLVEAAESCQVAIIHPGKPKNPAEPGLDKLLERAKAFA